LQYGPLIIGVDFLFSLALAQVTFAAQGLRKITQHLTCSAPLLQFEEKVVNFYAGTLGFSDYPVAEGLKMTVPRGPIGPDKIVVIAIQGRDRKWQNQLSAAQVIKDQRDLRHGHSNAFNGGLIRKT
jgi:hypothetical protein